MNDKTTTTKTVKGPEQAVAQFMSPRTGKMIYVFRRKVRGETPDAAIKRVKAKHGAAGVEHQLIA